jgi:hypothetical protein
LLISLAGEHGRENAMKIHDLECTLIHETDAAVLVTVDGEHKAWLPKSVIEIDRAPGGVEDGNIVVSAPEALLIDKGLV